MATRPTGTVTAADGVRLATSRWPGGPEGYVLVHGLASNRETWVGVAEHLHRSGAGVVAYDQRGHGTSTQTAAGHDLSTALDDLDAVLAEAGFDAPVLVGQSWGANLALAHGALRASTVAAIACVDGGVVDLGTRFPTWAACAAALRPPNLDIPLDEVAARIRATHPDWPAGGVAATVANLTSGPGGVARNRLPVEAHMQLVRAMWDHPPSAHHRSVAVPVLLLLARTTDGDHGQATLDAARTAAAVLRRGTVRWLEGDHDLHVQQPGVVAGHLADRRWR